MIDRSEFQPQSRKAWLLAIGQRLRAEYAALGDPIPDRLAALVAQLEGPAEPVPATPGAAAAGPAAEAHVASHQEPAPESPSSLPPGPRGQSTGLELR
jgi:hypothetical protein